MKAIYKRELSSYFNNMIAQVCIAFLMAVVGLYFMAYNLYSGDPSFADALSASLFIFLVVIPILTMRSMAEDRRSRTDQLLLTSPISVTKVVLGKFFALLTVYAIPCVLFCFCPVIIKLASGSSGQVYWATDYATLLAFFLLGALYLSIGLLISSTTESQILSAVGTFAVLFILYMWNSIVDFLPTNAIGNLAATIFILALLCLLLDSLTSSPKITAGVGIVGLAAIVITYIADSSLYESLLVNVLGKFSVSEVISSFASDQIFDVAGLLLYVSLTTLCLFLTVQVIQRRRWN
ncbi:MAG: ABC transporter permease subunit [Clostridiales bacterium]|nr:ABC transporter permease subunit [Clostridiales bacterium]